MIQEISLSLPLAFSFLLSFLSIFTFPSTPKGYQRVAEEEEVQQDVLVSSDGNEKIRFLKYFTNAAAIGNLFLGISLAWSCTNVLYRFLLLGQVIAWLSFLIASRKLLEYENALNGGMLTLFLASCLILFFQLQILTPYLYDVTIRKSSIEDPFTIMIICATILNLSLTLAVGNWRLRIEDHDLKNLSPEIGASVFSQLTFSWVNPMINHGNQFPLEKEDLKRLCSQENAHDILKEYHFTRNLSDSLAWRIIKINSRYILFQFGSCIIFTVLSFAAPFYLYNIVNALETPGVDRMIILPYLCKLFMFSIIQSLCGNQQYFTGRRVGNRSRIIVLDELFSKSLRRAHGISSSISEEGDDQASLGKIVTLMSVDAQRLQELGSYSHHFFVNMPLSLVLSISALYFVIGWSSIVGVGVVLLLGPISHFLGSFYIKAQEDLLSHTDARVSLMNELLQGIRIIKYFAWENSFMEKVNAARSKELNSVKKLFFANVSFGAFSRGTSILISFCTLYTYVMIAGHDLDAATAFTTVGLLNIVRQSMTELPHAILTVFKTKVSLDRISSFLGEQEIKVQFLETSGQENEDCYSDSETSVDVSEVSLPLLGFEYANFRFFGSKDHLEESLNTFSLRNLSINFPIGKLTLVCGPTAAGKSALLLSLLGELESLKGSYTKELRDSVAYAAQSAWLLNATIRDNILFGEDYDEGRYKRVIEGCSLVKDFQNLDGGDLTEIGEKGINMSGGQKQRISLARACYSKSSIVFLDDPLSAVDAPTARFLLHRAILELLQGRTIILVSHATHLVAPFADHIVSLKNGEILFQGSPVEATQNESDESLYRISLQRDIFGEDEKQDTFSPTANGEGQGLVEDEEKSTGSVAWSVYKMYFLASGGIIFVIMFLSSFALLNAAKVSNDWWLTVWTNQNTSPVTEMNSYASASNTSILQSSEFFIWNSFNSRDTAYSFYHTQSEQNFQTLEKTIYAILGVSVIIAGVVEDLVMLTGGLWASFKLHSDMLNSVLRAPLRFFEITPIGRVLNRFSRDLDCVDSQAIYSVQYFMECAIQALTVIVVIGSIAPVVLVIVPVIAFGFLSISSRYLNASRELKRLESITRSPIFSQFSEILTGICTVRAYKVESRFQNENRKKINENQEPFYYMWVSNRWLCLRTEFLSALVVFCAGLSIIFLKSINAGWAALMIVYAINLTDALLFSVRLHADMEMSMNSVERVQEYCMIEPEAPSIIEGNRPADEWPQKGSIDIKNLSLRYSESLPDVLKNVSFSVNPGEKVAVVGRTGAGKSTLSLAFFRIIPQSSGSIIIDGQDISKLGLYDLRSRLTIIPQDPVLFLGTLRSNLDPLSLNDDASLWDALNRVHFLDSYTIQQGSSEDLSASVSTLTESYTFSLDLTVAENGTNFSQGQRQLICLARSILQKNKIIFLDEATASVDNETDAKIQHAIRSEFKSSTVICIAHRLKTVIDYDKILVLDKGEVIEFGSPYDLMVHSPLGTFRSMCEESGHFAELLETASFRS